MVEGSDCSPTPRSGPLSRLCLENLWSCRVQTMCAVPRLVNSWFFAPEVRVESVFDMKLMFLLGLACSAVCRPGMAATITNSNPEALAAAIEAGGSVKLAFDGTVSLGKAFLIVTNTTVEATGHAVSLDGRNLTRHFAVTNGAVLRLINLALINGRHVGATGEPDQDGGPGLGGSIYNAGGKLELFTCNFVSNQAKGGDGGSEGSTSGGPGLGGAIFSQGGEVWATNCTFYHNACGGGLPHDTFAGLYPKVGGGFGGAVCTTNGQVSFVGVTFTNNVVNGSHRSRGGAVAQIRGALLITDSVFVTNQVFGAAGSDGEGGAIYSTNATAIIEQSSFYRNKANGGGPGRQREMGGGAGGAVRWESGTLEVKGCGFFFNEANGADWFDYGGVGFGGAMYLVPGLTGVVNLVNCTLAHNSVRGVC